MPACAASSCISPLNRDCEEIHRACKGIGTDEEKIIEILGSKNAQQRKEIKETYYAMYKEDLCKRLESGLQEHYLDSLCNVEGYIQKAVVLLMQEPADRDAMIARHSMEGWCTADRALTELLLELLKAHRCECEAVNMEQAKFDAKRLYEAGEGRCGTDEEIIIQILSERSVAQLRATFACYRIISI
eukprot:Gb_14809 [translate_table: standard]